MQYYCKNIEMFKLINNKFKYIINIMVISIYFLDIKLIDYSIILVMMHFPHILNPYLGI